MNKYDEYKMELCKRLIRQVKVLGLGRVYTSKNARKISSEIYDEIINSTMDFEIHVKSHLHDCGKKGELYKELWEDYNFQLTLYVDGQTKKKKVL